jgi:hypothetical protein
MQLSEYPDGDYLDGSGLAMTQEEDYVDGSGLGLDKFIGSIIKLVIGMENISKPNLFQV